MLSLVGGISIILLERLRLAHNVFNDGEKPIEYLTVSSRRGNSGFDDFELIAFIMTELVRANPLSTIELYRAQIIAIRGIGSQ